MTPKKHLPVHIRWLIRRDMPEVLAIEAQTNPPFWAEDDFLHCLRQRNCIGMAAEAEDKVLGFFLYELHKNHLFVLNLAVDASHHRQRIGTQMMNKLASKVSCHRRHWILADVWEGNLPFQQFLKTQDYQAIRVLPGVYGDTKEDAYRFVYAAEGYNPKDAANLPERVGTAQPGEWDNE